MKHYMFLYLCTNLLSPQVSMNARQDLVRILLPKSTFTDLFFLDSVCILHSCSRPPKTKSLGLVNDDDVGHQSISKISELSMDNDGRGNRARTHFKVYLAEYLLYNYLGGRSLICIVRGEKNVGSTTTMGFLITLYENL